MVKIKLAEAIDQNKGILGAQCNSLGKAQGRLFGSRKVYASYDAKCGWGFVQLNLFQRLARKLFGCYSSTRLKTITKKVSELQIKDKPINENFLCKINSVWQKTYQSQPFPSPLLFFGNAKKKVEKAQVFCFAESHGNLLMRKAQGKFINKHYNPETDIILVEGFVSGKVVSAKESQMTQYVDKSYKVQGWEPKEWEELRSKLSFHKKFDGMKKIEEEILLSLIATLPNEAHPSRAAFKDYETKLKELQPQIKEFVSYYVKDTKSQDQAIDQLNKLHEVVLSLGESAATLKVAFAQIMKTIRVDNEKAIYRYVTPEDMKLLKTTFNNRNISLCTDLKKYADQGKRIFLIAGAAHLLQEKNMPNIDIVNKALGRYQHVIITTPKVLR